MQPMGYVPYVIEKTGKGRERAYDIYSRLMKDRVIFIGTPINHHIANAVTAQLLFLNLQSKAKPIHMYINSPGGSVSDGLAILDCMSYVSNTINTYCIGQAASMGAVLLAAGSKGHRFILPHARVMIHQPWGGAQGTASDIQIQAEEILKYKRELNQILADATGKELEVMEKDTDRDHFFRAKEAIEYGLVDEILESQGIVEEDDVDDELDDEEED